VELNETKRTCLLYRTFPSAFLSNSASSFSFPALDAAFAFNSSRPKLSFSPLLRLSFPLLLFPFDLDYFQLMEQLGISFFDALQHLKIKGEKISHRRRVDIRLPVSSNKEIRR
jgi:hypothetical protein